MPLLHLSNEELSVLIDAILVFLREQQGKTAKEIARDLGDTLEKGSISESMLSILRKRPNETDKLDSGKPDRSKHYERLRRQVANSLLTSYLLSYKEERKDKSDEIEFRLSFVSQFDRRSGSHFIYYTWTASGLGWALLSCYREQNRTRSKSSEQGLVELITFEDTKNDTDPGLLKSRYVSTGTFEVIQETTFINLRGLSKKESVFRTFMVIQTGKNELLQPKDDFIFGTFNGVLRIGHPSCGTIVLEYAGNSELEARQKIIEISLNKSQVGEAISYYLQDKRIIVENKPVRSQEQLPFWENHKSLGRDYADVYNGFYVNASDGDLHRCLLYIRRNGTAVMVGPFREYSGYFKLVAHQDILLGQFDRNNYYEGFRFRLNLQAGMRQDEFIRGTYSGIESNVNKPIGGRILFRRANYNVESTESANLTDDNDKLYDSLRIDKEYMPRIFRYSSLNQLKEDEIRPDIYNEVRNYLIGQTDYRNPTDLSPDANHFFGDSPEYFRKIGWLGKPSNFPTDQYFNNQDSESLRDYAGSYECYQESSIEPEHPFSEFPHIRMHPLYIYPSGEIDLKWHRGNIAHGEGNYDGRRYLSFLIKDGRHIVGYFSFVVDRNLRQGLKSVFGLAIRQNRDLRVVASLVILVPVNDDRSYNSSSHIPDVKKYLQENKGKSPEQQETMENVLAYFESRRGYNNIINFKEPNSGLFDEGGIYFAAACKAAASSPNTGVWKAMLESAIDKGFRNYSLIKEEMKEGNDLYIVRKEVEEIIGPVLQ